MSDLFYLTTEQLERIRPTLLFRMALAALMIVKSLAAHLCHKKRIDVEGCAR